MKAKDKKYDERERQLAKRQKSRIRHRAVLEAQQKALRKLEEQYGPQLDALSRSDALDLSVKVVGPFISAYARERYEDVRESALVRSSIIYHLAEADNPQGIRQAEAEASPNYDAGLAAWNEEF